jgi:hypothetical protein
VNSRIALGITGTFSSTTQASGAFTVSDSSCSGSAAGTWTATLEAGRIRVLAGNNQTGTVAQALLAPLVVQVLDAGGNPAAGQPVTFAITSQPLGAANAQLSATSAVTDANGQATVSLTLGTVQGIYVVTATGPGGDQAVLLETAKPDVPAKTIKRSGDNQSVTPGSVLPVPICITVTDAFNNAVPDLAVNFSITSQPTGGQATLTVTAAATSTPGVACTQMSGGNQLGSYLETVDFPGTDLLPLTFTTTVSTPTGIAKTGGDGQTGAVGTALAPFEVKVTDAAAKPLAGAVVTFAIGGQPAGAVGTALAVTTCSTDVNGLCQTVLTLGSVAGSYTVTATVNGVPPVQFAATATGESYIVGDTYPLGTDRNSDADLDDAGEFGDGTLTIVDLIMMLRAVTGIVVPPACSDRFDAMDAYPVDTPTVRGGDAKLSILDLIITLRRVTGVDTSKPRRYSRNLVCPAGAGLVAMRAVAAPAAPESGAPGAGGSEAQAAWVELGAAVKDELGLVWVPLYLVGRSEAALAGVGFAVGFEGASRVRPTRARLRFLPNDAFQPPSLVDDGVPGALALAWLEGFRIVAGQRLLLGWVEAVAQERGTVPVLRLFGLDAPVEPGGGARSESQ